jgi:hypothetical protein
MFHYSLPDISHFNNEYMNICEDLTCQYLYFLAGSVASQVEGSWERGRCKHLGPNEWGYLSRFVPPTIKGEVLHPVPLLLTTLPEPRPRELLLSRPHSRILSLGSLHSELREGWRPQSSLKSPPHLTAPEPWVGTSPQPGACTSSISGRGSSTNSTPTTVYDSVEKEFQDKSCEKESGMFINMFSWGIQSILYIFEGWGWGRGLALIDNVWLWHARCCLYHFESHHSGL